MTIDKLIVLISGIGALLFTYWYFFMKKEKAVLADRGEVEIRVDGGYSPSNITIPVGKPTKIVFFRTDRSSCLEEVVISTFKIRKYLELNKKTYLEVTPKKQGDYPFECGMGMFHGKIIAK